MTPDRRFIVIGRTLFAVGLAGFAVLAFTYGDFVAGRAPAFPEGLPGRFSWAYLTAAGLLVSAGLIVADRHARWAVFGVGALILVWALLRNLPAFFASDFLSGQWTITGKSLVFFGGSWAIASALAPVGGGGALARAANRVDAFVYLGRICLGLFMILCGIQHYVHDEFVATLVPTWIPGAYFWTYFCGAALMAGGLGLMIPRTARLAAALTALMIFLWVFMLHIPRATSGLFDTRNEWTSVFEATALSGLALVLWRVVPEREQAPTAAAEARATA